MATQSMSPYLANLAQVLGQSGMQLWGPEAQRRRRDEEKSLATDDIANRLMTEEIRTMDGAAPRAEAVDPELEAEMRRMYPHLSTKADPFAGGAEGAKDILAIRHMADTAKQRDIENQFRVLEFNQGSERHDQLYGMGAQTRAEQERAEASRKAMTEKQNDLFRDTLGYTTNMRAALRQLQSAPNEDDYNAAADVAYSLYSAAVSRGLKVDPPQIQPFMSPEDRMAIEERRATVTDLDSQIRDRGEDAKDGANWWPWSKTLKERRDAAKEELESTPGYRRATPDQVPRIDQQRAIAEARAAIAKGADPAAVAARLEQLGIDISAIQ